MDIQLQMYNIVAVLRTCTSENIKVALNQGNYKPQQGFPTRIMINTFFHNKLYQWNLYSSVLKFVIVDTDENGEYWYVTNNNQFTVSE